MSALPVLGDNSRGGDEQLEQAITERAARTRAGRIFSGVLAANVFDFLATRKVRDLIVHPQDLSATVDETNGRI